MPDSPLRLVPAARIRLDVDPPLAHWLRSTLTRLRPGLECVDSGHCDLRICYLRPPAEPVCHTLWIASVERHPHLARLSPRLWRLSAPFTAARLRRILDEILG